MLCHVRPLSTPRELIFCAGLRIFNIIIISVAPVSLNLRQQSVSTSRSTYDAASVYSSRSIVSPPFDFPSVFVLYSFFILPISFIWAMITATTNRMIVTISSNVGIAPASSHPTQEQQLTYNEMDPQFHTQGLTTLTLSEPSSPQTLMEMTPVSSKWKRPGSISTKKTKSSKEGLLSPSTKAYGQSPGHSPGYPPSPYSASKEPRSHHSPRSPSAFPAPSMRSNFMDLEEAPTIAQRQAQWQRGGRSPASDSNRTYI